MVGIIGIAIMLEATRRAMGTGMLITTGLFLLFIFAGPYMPEVIQHKGASLQRLVSHMWLTTEGVYGVALGVSVQFSSPLSPSGRGQGEWPPSEGPAPGAAPTRSAPPA